MSGAVGARRSIDLVTDNPELKKGQPALGEAALFGLCPCCGAKTLFDGWIKFSDRCEGCGLDYSRFNVGDGPAAFLTMIVGAIVVGLAMWLQLSFEPPWWLHVILWLPLTIGGVLFGLRMAKGALLVREYLSSAGEHRHDGSDLK